VKATSAVGLPLRLSVALNGEYLRCFEKLCSEGKEAVLYSVVESVASAIGEGPHLNYNSFLSEVESKAKEMAVKLSAKSKNFMKANLAVIDESAEPVINKIYKAGKAEPNPLYGLYETAINGKKVVVEYEPDSKLRDSEQVPLLEDGGIAAFVEREVLPYTPDAWVDGSKTQIGYEISFIRHFHKPESPRSLDQIKADILALEKETDGLLDEIVEGGF
jgi:type I restriction enzyme M protein